MKKEQGLIHQKSTFMLTATQQAAGKRVDTFIAEYFSDYSRSFLKKLFSQKHVLINESKQAKPGHTLKQGDQIWVSFPEQTVESPNKNIPDDIGIKIIAQEPEFLIINKPAGLVVHPPNNTCQKVTLTDWLTKKDTSIAHVGVIDRPGIVYKIDRDWETNQ